MSYPTSFEANHVPIENIFKEIAQANSPNKAQLDKLSLLINSACRSNRHEDIIYRRTILNEYNKLSNENKDIVLNALPHWRLCVYNPVFLPKLYNVDNIIKIIYDKKYKIYRVQFVKQNKSQTLPVINVSESIDTITADNVKPCENWGDECDTE
jgi:hypothetical protein